MDMVGLSLWDGQKMKFSLFIWDGGSITRLAGPSIKFQKFVSPEQILFFLKNRQLQLKFQNYNSFWLRCDSIIFEGQCTIGVKHSSLQTAYCKTASNRSYPFHPFRVLRVLCYTSYCNQNCHAYLILPYRRYFKLVTS